MNAASSQSIPNLLAALLAHRDLSEEQMRFAIQEIIAGRCGEAETAALLIALRMKGESPVELAAAASVLREQMVRLETSHEGILDTCGTGGDGLGTFNVSTATALVVAAAGVPVVKHGNRAVSSRSGSADVLTELGVAVEGGVAWARRCLETVGIAFCFAPHFHPALARVAPLRQRLRVPTLFNFLGPLVNPAGAVYQLLGTGRPELLDPLAGALARLGGRRAVLVCGCDGLDEVSLSATTLIRVVSKGVVQARTILAWPHVPRQNSARLTLPRVLRWCGQCWRVRTARLAAWSWPMPPQPCGRPSAQRAWPPPWRWRPRR